MKKLKIKKRKSRVEKQEKKYKVEKEIALGIYLCLNQEERNNKILIIFI